MAHHNRSNDLSVITDAPKALCAVPIQSNATESKIRNYTCPDCQGYTEVPGSRLVLTDWPEALLIRILGKNREETPSQSNHFGMTK